MSVNVRLCGHNLFQEMDVLSGTTTLSDTFLPVLSITIFSYVISKKKKKKKKQDQEKLRMNIW